MRPGACQTRLHDSLAPVAPPRTPVAPGSSSALSITRCARCLVTGATLLFIACMQPSVPSYSAGGASRIWQMYHYPDLELGPTSLGESIEARLTSTGNKRAVPRFRLHPNSGICPRGSTSPSTSSTFHLFHACRAGAENIRRAPSRRRYSYPPPLRSSIPPGCSTRFIICPP